MNTTMTRIGCGLLTVAALGLATTVVAGPKGEHDRSLRAHATLAAGQNDAADVGQDDVDRPAADPNFTLRLGERSFDPLAIDMEPGAGDPWQAEGDPEGDLRLVQFFGPMQQAWLDALMDAGVQPIQYVHPHTYIVWGSKAAIDDAAAQPAVRWAGEFVPGYRVLPKNRNLGPAVQDTRIIVYRGADEDQLRRDLTDLGADLTGWRRLDDRFAIIGLTIPGDRFPALAAVPGVYSVQVQPTDGGLRGEMTNQINANNVDGSNIAFPGYQTWLTSLGLSGDGVIIANVDGGIEDTHPDLAANMVGCVGSTCGGGGSSGHGTHTAGIMAANGASGVTDSFGFLRGLGVAPGASLVEQVYSPTFTQPGGMLELMKQSYANGASLSGNSWGPSGFPQGYDNDTMQVDIGVRDTDDSTPGDQPLSFVLSFMNGNGGTSTQGSPDEAKNLFNIGSTKGQTFSGAQIPDINDLSSNTAHGPALDGRTIPHMVAPGCEVDSTYSGGGYDLLCGTSMASPAVSGAVALFIEYYRNLEPQIGLGGAEDPSPALIKAAFLPVAHDLAGNLDADGGTLGHPFDSKQGWGRLNLEAVVDANPEAVRYFDNPQVFDNTGESWTTIVSPYDAGEPVRMMLVWTDAPGHGLGGSTPAWNNDLDLVVEQNGQTYFGNSFGPDGFSATGGSRDGMNNTEGVFLPAGGGPVTITVEASNINSDGLPNAGDLTDQDFALVVYNAAVEPGFSLSASPTSQGVCAPDDAVYTIDVSQVLDFSEDVTLSASGQPAGTTVAFSTNPVSPGGSSVMTISNTGAAAAGDYAITVDGVAPSLSRSINVSLALDAGAPGAVALASPGDGASGVSLAPTLSWSASATADDYDVQVASDAGFGTLVASAVNISDTSYTVTVGLDPVSEYFWRVRGGNGCGDGAWSDARSFTTADVPAILLVDDDDNSPDVQSTYTALMSDLGLDYDLWDTSNNDANEPGLADLAPYEAIIWFTGDEFGGACGPSGATEAVLAEWLDNGGCLLITSQDYHWDRDLTTFMQNYLGVSSVDDDETQTSATGAGPFAGMGPYSLTFPSFSNWSDVLVPNGDGVTAFTGDQGDAAVSKDGGVYRTAYLAFPVEAISGSANQAAVIQRFLEWCSGLEPDCPADLNGSGAVDSDDLFELLGDWGGSGAGDLDGSGTIDADDLFELLGAWGDC